MKKKFKNVTAIVVCGLVLFSMNGCLRANSTEKEVSDTTTATASSTDSTADSAASGDSTASTEKKDSATSAVDANESKKDTTAAADKKDSANSGDAKAESTDSAAADSTTAETEDSTPANTEEGNNTDSTAQTEQSADTTDSANVVGASDIETPNAEGVSLTITTKDGDIDLEQGDKWSISYDGGAAEDLDLKDPVEINEDTRSVKVTYPKDAVFYTLQASATGKGNINSKGILWGNCYLGTESGSVNFATSAPLEEYNLFVSSSSGKASVNGEDASGPDGYNNIGTTEKMVIVSSNTGDVTLTFNQ